jgi:hypothetical protein
LAKQRMVKIIDTSFQTPIQTIRELGL